MCISTLPTRPSPACASPAGGIAGSPPAARDVRAGVWAGSPLCAALALIFLFPPALSAQSAPVAPTGLTVKAGNGQATLGWDNPNDSTITGYEYRFAEHYLLPAEWMAIPDSATTTSHTITVENTPYYVQLRAKAGPVAGPGTAWTYFVPNDPPTVVTSIPDQIVLPKGRDYDIEIVLDDLFDEPDGTYCEDHGTDLDYFVSSSDTDIIGAALVGGYYTGCLVETPVVLEVWGKEDSTGSATVTVIACDYRALSGADRETICRDDADADGPKRYTATMRFTATSTTSNTKLVFAPAPLAPEVGEGAETSWTVKLSHRPSSAMEVRVKSNDPDAVKLKKAAADTPAASVALRFEQNNWDTAQTVIAIAQVDGDNFDETVTVTHDATHKIKDKWGEREFGGADVDVTVTVIDDDVSDLAVLTIVEAEGSTAVEEEGGEDTWTVALSIPPTANVTITVASRDPGSVKLRKAAIDAAAASVDLTFTSSNWETRQTVIAVGVSDSDRRDESVAVRHTAVSGDPAYSGKTGSVLVEVADDDKGVSLEIVEADGATMIGREGDSDTWTVELSKAPTSTVKVRLETGDTRVATVSPATMTFTSSDWNVPQTATVTGGSGANMPYGVLQVTHIATLAEFDGIRAIVKVSAPDTTKPTVTSIKRQMPATSPTNANSLTWRVTFSEDVRYVRADKFTAVNDSGRALGSPTVTVTAVNNSASVYDVTVAGGALLDLTAEGVYPRLVSGVDGNSIEDLVGNPLDLTDEPDPGGYIYVLDNTTPTVAITGVPPFATSAFAATFTFSETVTGFEAGDIAVTGATASDLRPGPGIGIYTATITPYADYLVSVAADAATDTAGNGNAPSDVKEGRYTADDQELKDTLAGIARATLRSATAVVGRRFEASPGEPALTLAGERVALERRPGQDDAWAAEFREPGSRNRAVDGDTLLGQSAFSLPLGAAGSGWTMWGRGDLQQFKGRSNAGSHDGSLRSGWLGVDARLDTDRFAGIAVSRSRGQADGSSGTLKTSLTALWAYLQLGDVEGPRVGLLAGAGQGEAEHRPSAAGRSPERADLTMQLASVSGRWPVARMDAVALSLTGDAGYARMSTDGTGTALAGLEVEVRQFRAGIEARHDGMTIGEDGLRLVPSGSLLLRRDGGDGITGTGLEIEGGFALGRPGSRFSVDARGRWLAMHSASGVSDWGFGFEIRLAPDAKGHGLSYSLSTRRGAPEGGALEEREVFAEPVDGTADDGGALSMRAGYGFGAGSGVLTPFAETELGDDNRRYVAGFRFAGPDGLDASLAVERRELATGKAENRIGLELRMTL